LVFITKNLKKDKELKEFYHCDEIGIKNIFAQKSILLILPNSLNFWIKKSAQAGAHVQFLLVTNLDLRQWQT